MRDEDKRQMELPHTEKQFDWRQQLRDAVKRAQERKPEGVPKSIRVIPYEETARISPDDMKKIIRELAPVLEAFSSDPEDGGDIVFLTDGYDPNE